MTDFEYFTVTDEHLKLLENTYIGWDACEFGAPAIDPKRPYGNSDVVGDMLEILGYLDDVKCEDDTEEIRDKYDNHMRKLHCEMQNVLQILVSNLCISEGQYKKERYWGKWEKCQKLN